jgi:hypothetical protein
MPPDNQHGKTELNRYWERSDAIKHTCTISMNRKRLLAKNHTEEVLEIPEAPPPYLLANNWQIIKR